MEGGIYPPWRNGSWPEYLTSENMQETEEFKSFTPREPMEFLSRSWSLSASQISKALSEKQKQTFLNTLPEPISAPQLAGGKMIVSGSCGRIGGIGKWLHENVKKKDRRRVENARVHSALSIAGLASAVAAVAATEEGSKLEVALASATQLLASYCVEMAELAGVDRERLNSTVSSAIHIQTPGDLITLTAAAATALRGEAALTARLPKDAKKNASISPYDKVIAETQWLRAFDDAPCMGDLLQLTAKGALRWRHVHVYIKKSQVKVNIKSKHVGGAFSKNNKCVVYGVCDKDNGWPYKKEREAAEELYFGLKTAQGLLEFKCQNKLHKQIWVDGIEFLLRRVNSVEETEHSLKILSISTNT